MEGLTKKQIDRIERIRAERAPRIQLHPSTIKQFGLAKSSAESVLTNRDLLKLIGSYTNPKADGFLVFIDGEQDIFEIGKSLTATRPSQQKSLFIGRYKPLTSNGPFRGRTVELFWPNINAKGDDKRLEQKRALNFSFPRFNQDIFTKPATKERIFFLPLNTLLKIQHPYGDFRKEDEIDKIKKQAYFNDMDYPILSKEKLIDMIK